MARRVLLVRHGAGPDDDRVVTWLRMNGLEPDIRHPFAGESLGDIDEDLAGTVIYGGPYNAYDTALHPFLNEEYRWIGAVRDAGLPMLGICQGAQMIAHHAGAPVGPLPEGWHEFGYYEVRPTEAGRAVFPEPLHLAESHFHGFELPTGAERLASSDLFPNQAARFAPGVYGFQFHAEQTIEGFRRWQAEKPGVYGQPGVQEKEEQTRLMHLHDAAQAEWFYGFLGTLFGGARE